MFVSKAKNDQEELEDLLPHRSPMLLLQRVIQVDENTVEAEAQIGEKTSLFARKEGDVGAWLILELMAQTVGVYAGAKFRRDNMSPRIGFLLGTRTFQVSRSRLRVGEVVSLQAKCIFFADSDFPSQFACTAAINGIQIAEATITTFLPNSLPKEI